LLSLLAYLGLAPVLSALRVRWDDAFRRHHRDQALALLLVLQAGIVLEVLLEVAALYFVVHFPGLTRVLVEAKWLGYVVLGVLLAWALAWAVAVLLALAGSSWGLPLVRRLARTNSSAEHVSSRALFLSSPSRMGCMMKESHNPADSRRAQRWLQRVTSSSSAAG